MTAEITEILRSTQVEASAPCRIDMGGTLDIRTFSYPLHRSSPCTFNIALNLRTYVRLRPFKKGMIKVSSKGFESAVFPLAEAPFDHPLGLIFAIAYAYHAAGVHIEIESASPPQSALGGSSAASVALVKAFSALQARAGAPSLSRNRVVQLAHGIEESVAGVPCGFQDQLAAAYGGVNLWYWPEPGRSVLFKKRIAILPRGHKRLEKQMLVAYCGIQHVSKDINSKWMRQFLAGQNRDYWIEIIANTRRFAEVLAQGDFAGAADTMNRETDLRREMTPEVIDAIGEKLVAAARANRCGARFTGAGGGGCLWAVGEAEAISQLKTEWEAILARRKTAYLLNTGIDAAGVVCNLKTV